MSAAIWPLVHHERQALLDDLGSSTDRFDTPSLCPGWTVRDVLAHMASTAGMTPPKFVAGLVSSGFSFDRFIAKGIASHRGRGPEDALKHFEAVVAATTGPPGPTISWLGETLVHAEDIRFPLGIQHDYDMTALRTVADFYKNSNTLIGAKKRIAGVRLQARDTDWSHGDGPPAEGPMLALVMAMTGRQAFLDRLTGPGVEVLRSR